MTQLPEVSKQGAVEGYSFSREDDYKFAKLMDWKCPAGCEHEKCNHVPNFNGDDFFEVRKLMAAKGWESQDRITQSGWGEKVGFSIWFKKWYPKMGFPFCGHAHVDDLDFIPEATLAAAFAALEVCEEGLKHPYCVEHGVK